MAAMASPKDWLEGARLRTLPAAAAPVLIGIGAAIHLDAFSWGMSLLALLVALSLQIGVNFSNDYSDGVRGTDEDRVGPVRMTASGLVSPKVVLAAALGNFAVAGAAGLALVIWSGQWWLLAVGVAAVAAAWFYTGGSSPYGYLGVGLSEVFVFLFFGLVATVGTTFVQTLSAPWWLWTAASGIGLVSVALLMVNNIRDIPTDSQVGKRTVAVRLGDRASRILYVVLAAGSAILGGVATSGMPLSLVWPFGVGAVLLFASLFGILPIVTGASGKNLLGALRNTGLYALGYGLVLGSVFAVGTPPGT